MPVSISCVDSFTDRAFAGNPAAVCLLDASDRPREDAWMQQVAAEMNLAETAFVVPRSDGFGLRWFTPVVEVDLCGHATLASAHVLWTTGVVKGDAPIRFHTKSGVLGASRADGAIELDFPSEPASPAEPSMDLAGALGAKLSYIGRNRMDYIGEVDSVQTLRGLAPDMEALKTLATRGVIVTCSGDGTEYDFLSRFFAPGAGIPEDPVTGSAHCCLAPFWSDRLNKRELVGYQASPRGGVVRVRASGTRVQLAGHAVTVYNGTLLV
jgi:PhzF family phenazine biosynthesis protein